MIYMELWYDTLESGHPGQTGAWQKREEQSGKLMQMTAFGCTL
jgi:hypothetical protein